MSTGFLCSRCGDTDPKNFYKCNGAKTKCKKCHTMESHHKQRLLKDKAIELLGNQCKDCGATGSPWIFDFHHRDMESKEFSWGEFRTSNWAKLKAELEKCDLLCAVCHRLRHEKNWIESLPKHHPYFD